jgi:predicted MFS family arabinose efflux permease
LILAICAFFFVSSGGRMVPATALVSGTALPQTRGSFMSSVSSVQQLSSAISSYLAGLIVTSDAAGRLVNYQIVGYVAIVFTFVAIFLSRRIHAIEDNSTPSATEVPVMEH